MELITSEQIDELKEGIPDIWIDFNQRDPLYYLMSCIIPKKTEDGTYVSVDLVYQKPERSSYTYMQFGILYSDASELIGKSELIKDTVHLNEEVKVKGIGLGAVQYFTMMALCPRITEQSYVGSNMKARSRDAHIWWRNADARGIVQLAGNMQYVLPEVAAKNLYIWKYGSVPMWSVHWPRKVSVAPQYVQDAVAKAIENGPPRSQIESMLGNLENGHSVRSEARRRSKSALSSLQSVLKPSALQIPNNPFYDY